MRYPAVVAGFLLVFSGFFAACTFDDGTEPADESVKAVDGKDLVLDIGSAKLTISRFAIGTGPGLLPPGSRAKLELIDDKVTGHTLYSPQVRFSFKDPAGAAITNLNLDPPAQFELSYDVTRAEDDGVSLTELALLHIKTAKTQIKFASSPANDTEFGLVYPGRLRANLTNPSRLVVANATTVTPPPAVVALTGTVSTILTSTAFQLASTGNTFTANLVVPTTNTASPPTVLTLNDAAFDSTNPLNPNNRILTVTTGSITYTTDAAGASVSVQISTFTASASSGTMVGTLVQQSGTQTLAVNFTWTTGTAPATALGGTVSNILGRRTITLSDAGQVTQVVVVMPDTLPNGTLDPIVFNDASFDSGDPLNAAGRVLTVTENNETFSSDVPVLGSVTLTFTSWNNVTLAGAGTITGTVVSATPTSKTLNYSFTTTAGGGGGTGSLTPGTAVDVTSNVADEAVAVYDALEGGYLVVYLSDVGTTNRTLEVVSLHPDTLATQGSESYEPTVALLPAGGLHMDSDQLSALVIGGATGDDPGSATAILVFYDYVFASLNTEVNLGTGTAPRVSFHPDEGLFVVAWQSGVDVKVRVYEEDGTQVGTEFTAFTNATLAGLASARNVTDEALITATDGSGVVGRYVTVSTGAAAGAQFDISTTLAGGMCVFDDVGDHYVVLTQELVLGFFTSQVLVTIAPSGTATIGTDLTLVAINATTQGVAGNVGVLLGDADGNLYPVKTAATGTTTVTNPVFSASTGLDIDTTADGPALAAAGTGRYLLVAAKGATGLTVVPLVLAP